MRAPPELAGLNFPGFALKLLRGDLSLHDDVQVRRYVFSLLAASVQACGERSRSSALTAAGYVEPRVAPGRDVAAFGLEQGLRMLQGYGQAMRSGSLGDLAAAASGPEYRNTEGMEDGATIVSAFGCGSREYRDFVANIERLMERQLGTTPPAADLPLLSAAMSPAYRSRHNIPDPEAMLAQRRRETATTAVRRGCEARYDSPSFCGCLVSRLQADRLSDEDWAAISASFPAIVAVAGRRPSVGQVVSACVRG